jgi:glutathione S-transferase
MAFAVSRNAAASKQRGSEMKLYYSSGACSLAPHIILREANLPFELEKVDLKAKKTEKGRDYAAINPKGYVPALELDDGEVLTEGVVIQQYLADLAPKSKLAPARGTRERLRLEEWLGFITTELHKGFSPLFNPATPDDYKSVAKEGIAKRFDYVEKTLSDGRTFLTGDTLTIADAYLFVIAGWARYVGIDLARWPKLSAFVGRVSKRPAVEAALVAEGLKQAA